MTALGWEMIVLGLYVLGGVGMVAFYHWVMRGLGMTTRDLLDEVGPVPISEEALASIAWAMVAVAWPVFAAHAAWTLCRSEFRP